MRTAEEGRQDCAKILRRAQSALAGWQLALLHEHSYYQAADIQTHRGEFYAQVKRLYETAAELKAMEG